MAVIYPVILCGGSGTRLWPLSRQSMPKQFLSLIGQNSLFQQAAQRVSGSQFADPLIVTSNEYRFIAAQQLTDIGLEHSGLILEPLAKNTAPAILAAAEILYQQDPDALLLILPSDHYIPDQQALIDLVLAAKQPAIAGSIVTFGIKPDRPETGYGYIELGRALPNNQGYSVRTFHEKPNKKRAKFMLDSGRYMWNSGMIFAQCKTLLASARVLVPDMLVSVRKAISKSASDLDFQRLCKEAWEEVKPVSIDHAILEKANNLMMFSFQSRWSDLGDWNALKYEIGNLNGVDGTDSNVIVGSAKLMESKSCLIWSDNPDQLIAGIGIKDLVVVSTADAVLVASKGQLQNVKTLVDTISSDRFSRVQEQSCCFRPWGWYKVLVLRDHLEIRELHLNPGSFITNQKHDFRSEIWLVTEGEAEVNVAKKNTTLHTNDLIRVMPGVEHKLQNNTKDRLTLIELRVGDYLGDDDVDYLI